MKIFCVLLVSALLLIPSVAGAAGRAGSHRVGGHGANGKGSHYVGAHKSSAVGRFIRRHL